MLIPSKGRKEKKKKKKEKVRDSDFYIPRDETLEYHNNF